MVPAPSAVATPEPSPTPAPKRELLGEILRDRGVLSDQDLTRAIALQEGEEARFGDILLAHSMVTQDELYQALAYQYKTMIADLRAEPPDVRLIDHMGADDCIRKGVVPWKRVGGATLVICSRPDEFETLQPDLPAEFGQVRLAVAPEPDIQAALIAARHRALAHKAEHRVSDLESCRNWNSALIGRVSVAIILSLMTLFVISPLTGFILLTAWAVVTLTLNSLLKAAAAIMHIRRRKHDKVAFYSQRHSPGIARLPTVSIMVPLFKEREIAGRLVKRLAALTYPRELLDICLVVEEDDILTQTTLAGVDLPRWMRQITVPRGAVKTKPRALNFALDFCRGSIIGVYDAEDAPDPDQIHRVVRRFHERGRDVACLQGILDFYNARTNWLSRCFTVEYATWFRVMLPGLERLGFAIPLGGTTLFFRRDVLEELGGWDAHNVTEDADLGIRLARHGYRTEMIDTVTREEANCRPWPWIKQRSRWIKGYAMTYGVHMRNPGQLRRDVGLWRFLGIQLLFAGSLSQTLLAPVLWTFWALPLGLPHPLINVMPTGLMIPLATIFLLSEVLTIAVGILAVSTPNHKFLRWWVPTLHFYFPLASLAALKGFVEIVTRPFYWDKTTHGVFDTGAQSAPEQTTN